MEGLQVNRFQLRCDETTDLDVLELTVDDPSKEEKDYQRLINEKLKSAADWDLRDSKMFSIG